MENEMEGDWVCPKCKELNFARRVFCFQCKIPKPGGRLPQRGTADVMLDGDWRCQDCGEHNFAKRDRCYGCSSLRYSAGKVEDGAPMLKGDWICYHCKQHNFARRKICFGCNTPKYNFNRPGGFGGFGGSANQGYGGGGGRGMGAFGGGVSVYPGDWKCNKCNELNFARRVVCFSCNTSKEDSQSTNITDVPPKPIRYEGDWMCAKCNQNNFARRIVCFNCKTPKPGVEISTPSSHAAQTSAQTTPPSTENENENLGNAGNSAGNIETGEGTGNEGEGGEENENNENNSGNNSNNNSNVNTENQVQNQVTPIQKTTVQLLEGDWICKKCSEHNFARRITCFCCDHPKHPFSPPPLGRGAGMMGRGRGRVQRPIGNLAVQKMQPDDWTCLRCNGHNFAWRTFCFTCEAPKILRGLPMPPMGPRGRLGAPARGPLLMKTGDWICQKCKSHNFARRLDCFNCRSPK